VDKVFENLKIVELASVLAGPAVGMFFAELGATVLKVENKTTGGDVTRNWHISKEDRSKTAAYFHAINYKKTNVFWDLKSGEDYGKLIKEILDADIVISNFNNKTASKFKVDYDTFSAKNPQLIYAQLTGFANNPSRAAYDVVLQAESGFLSMCGISENQKARMPVALIDVLAAHQLKEGILIAMLKRIKSGKGMKIECSLDKSAIASLANQATNYLMVNHVPQPIGTQHPNIAPYGDLFNTKDGQEIVLSIGSDKQFQNLCTIINADDIKDNDDYKSNADRVKNRKQLVAELGKYIQEISSEELFSQAEKNKVPIGHVKNLEQVFNTKTGKEMVLESEDGAKRVSTIAFEIIE
jgi:crotonobetainyl-CoA:carnitine CoA-transferase CaiB-like acyl-CoA transferase